MVQSPAGYYLEVDGIWEFVGLNGLESTLDCLGDLPIVEK